MKPVYLVSGLPRSGTSLMMRMLEAAGLPVMTDGERGADEDNPRGYYEFERVKGLPQDVAWLPECRGKAVKVISRLMLHLPDTERYRVVFMRRNVEEILHSQSKMLERRGVDEQAHEAEHLAMKRNFILHLGEVEEFLASRSNFDTLFVSYNRLMHAPEVQVCRVAEFVGQLQRAETMRAVVEPSLYRQRADQLLK